MSDENKKLDIDFNLNDNAKKTTIWVGAVIVIVSFFGLIFSLRKK